MSKPGADPASEMSLGDAWYGPSGIRHVGGANLNRALVRNVRTLPAMLTRIMHHLPRFCMPGPHAYCTRTPSIRPVWIGGVNSLCNACRFDLP